MKKAYYFPHDTNACMDPKTREIISEFGIAAYGIYWIIIEMLASQKNYKIKSDKLANIIRPLIQGTDAINEQEHSMLDISNFELEKAELFYHKGFTKKNTEKLLNYMFEIDLLQKNGNCIWSNSLNSRMQKIENIANINRENAKKGWEKRKEKCDRITENDATAKPKKNARNENTRNENEIKENEMKEDKMKENDRAAIAAIEKPTASKPIEKYNDDDFKLSKLLEDLIIQNTPTYKKKDLKSWANEVRKMREVDKRTVGQIEFVIKWSQQDNFWQANILSTAKLRKQFDTLVAQIKRDNDKKSKNYDFINN